MICLDLTLKDPRANLALEEALLEEAERGRAGEILRFWESPTHFVVLGAGGSVGKEVDVAACEKAGIPILRRCSGGGTVIQGPGCLNYTLILRKESRAELNTIGSTNCYILQKMARALIAVGVPANVEGTSDLAIAGVKISGNAQRRKRDGILFHGTLLHSLDIALISRLLREPDRQPAYRARRLHGEFIRNVGHPPEVLKAAIRSEWNCTHPFSYSPPLQLVEDLIDVKYSRKEWNFAL